MQFEPRSQVLTGPELLELANISPDDLAMKSVSREKLFFVHCCMCPATYTLALVLRCRRNSAALRKRSPCCLSLLLDAAGAPCALRRPRRWHAHWRAVPALETLPCM